MSVKAAEIQLSFRTKNHRETPWPGNRPPIPSPNIVASSEVFSGARNLIRFPGCMCFQADLHVLARSGINSALLCLRLKPPCALSRGQRLLPGQRFSKTKQVLRQFKPLPAGTPRATCSAPRPGTIRSGLFQFHAPAIRRTAVFRANAPGRPDPGYRSASDFSGGPT